MENKMKLTFTIGLLAAALFISGCAFAPQPQLCGNAICEENEAQTCPQDCGINAGGIIIASDFENQAPTTCIESDRGNDIYLAGYVAGNCIDCKPQGIIGGNADNCVTQNTEGILISTEESPTLMEFYCSTGGWKREITACPNGCNQGACRR